ETMTRLTHGMGYPNYPIWTPDRRYVAFRAAGGIFWTRSDGSGQPQALTQSKNAQFTGSFSPDGKQLAFTELNPEGVYGIWTAPVEIGPAGLKAGKPELFLQTPFDATHPRFSPDGSWLAYDSAESGTMEVYVKAFPDRGGKWQISNGGGA